MVVRKLTYKKWWLDFQGLLVQPFFLKQGNHTPDAPLFLGVILNTIEYLKPIWLKFYP